MSGAGRPGLSAGIGISGSDSSYSAVRSTDTGEDAMLPPDCPSVTATRAPSPVVAPAIASATRSNSHDPSTSFFGDYSLGPTVLEKGKSRDLTAAPGPGEGDAGDHAQAREVWDVEDPFGRVDEMRDSTSGGMAGWASSAIGEGGVENGARIGARRDREGIGVDVASDQADFDDPTASSSSRAPPPHTIRPIHLVQPAQHPSMSPSAPQPEQVPLRPIRSRLGMLDGPTPKDPDHTTSRWLGELLIGFALCQCLPCCKHDPRY